MRALPKNPIVVADFGLSDAIQTGTYVVRPQDLPMIQIHQCDLSMIHLCVRQPLVERPTAFTDFSQ